MRSEGPFSSLGGPFTRSEGPPHVLRGPGHALRGAPVAQGPLRYYIGTSLVAIFHPKGPQGPSCAQGALPSVQKDHVERSGAVGNQGPSLAFGGPSAPKGGSTESGACGAARRG